MRAEKRKARRAHGAPCSMPQRHAPCQIGRTRNASHAGKKRGPRMRTSSFRWSRAGSAATVMAAMVVPARSELDRLQLEAGDAGRDVQSGLSLQADRLQRVGVGGTANQKIAPAADADRCIGADAAIAAGEFAAAEPAVR